MIFILNACGSHDQEKTHEVILVFNNPVEGPSFRDLGTKIKYIDDNLIPHVIDLDRNSTHKLNTLRENIDLAWQDKNRISHHFLLTNGDSIHFTLKDKWLVAEIKNRRINKYETNFEREKQIDLYHERSSSLEDFLYFWNLSNSEFSTISGKDIAIELNNLKKRAGEELAMENTYIDSLFEAGKLSGDVAHYYKLKNSFIRRKLKLYQLTSINFTDTLRMGNLFSIKGDQLGDSTRNLAAYTFYDDMLSSFYQQGLAKDTTNEISIDYIMSISWLPDEVKQSLVFKHLDKILESCPVDEGNALLSHMNYDSTIFKGWKNHFNEKYMLDQKVNSNWKLEDRAGETLTFDDLLQHYKGELLYIDFWASWCIPCLREMPESKKLSSEYSGKPVRVIYLSVDRSVENWKRAQKRFLDFADAHSFYIDSLNFDKVKDAFQLTKIPRYMLFGNDGKLLHQNAPRPGSREIRELFNKYL
ncbi:MAG: TlpA family protein disulfide reductase [Cytophagales bacterium]|nr:TlpA family protein disulfide reductase [Cytophagales bacterium]